MLPATHDQHARVDLVPALREAIQLAGPGWSAQPSRLRLCLNDVLGPSATSQRPNVHQLVVAAEERVPSRLASAPSDGASLGELASDLAATRGWTMEAATWAVSTWASALGVAGQPEDGGAVTIGVQSAAIATVGPTVLPAEEVAGRPSIATSSLAPVDLASFAPLSELPRSGTRRPTRYASEVLGFDVDLAFAVRTGVGPAATIPFAVGGLVGILLGGLFGTALWFGCAVMIFGLAFMSPYRVLALRGDQAYIFSTRGPWSSRPKGVRYHGWRAEIRPAGGWMLPVVAFGGERLRFYFPTTRAARLLTRSWEPTRLASEVLADGSHDE